MNIDNIKINKTYKNYKELCTILEISPKGGSTKIAHLKQFKRYFNYTREGQKYIINEIYEAPRSKNDSRSKGNNRKYESIIFTHPNIIKYLDMNKNIGIDINSISQFSNIEIYWKCSECEEVFKKYIEYVCKSKKVLCPICSLSEGAKMINDSLNKYNIQFEREYIFNDLKGLKGGLLRFDFVLFNENKIATIIEYDGEYHDNKLNPDSINYKIISKHDNIKNKYCKDKNIKLIRINFKHKEFINYIVTGILFELNLIK